MKKLLVAACLTSSAWAAPFVYQFTGTIDVTASVADFDATIDLDGDSHQLFYRAGTDLVTGGAGVAVTNTANPDLFDFSFQATSGSGGFTTLTLSQTPGTVYTGAPAPPGGPTVSTSFPNGIPLSFTGGGFGPDFSINFSAVALAPELDGASAYLPILSAALLLGMARKRRTA